MVRNLNPGLQRIAQFMAGGRMDEALQACRHVIRDHDRDPRVWYMLSEIQFQSGLHTDALASIERSVALDATEPGYHLQLGKCLLQTGRRRDAFAAAESAVALDPKSARAIDGLGTLFSQLFEVERAVPFFTRAVSLEPANPAYLFNLATAQRMLGELTAAEATCERVIAADPQSCAARYLRADLGTQSTASNHICEMEALLKSGVRHWHDEMLLCRALAKECEDVGLYEHAFGYTQRACALQRERMRYRVEDDIAVMDGIIAVHTAERLANWRPGDPSREPIFIVGLPRTGTTLVERILSGHSEVFAAGELDTFPAELARATGRDPAGAGRRESAVPDAVCSIDPATLGRAYVEGTRPRTGHTPHFIDKLPRNYLYCGLIHAALPGARIIALERDPLDACYAVHKAVLSGNFLFALDLDDLGRYYIAWSRLMAHWRLVLGESLLTVRYEELVAAPENTGRRVIEFCGLRWEDSCMDFQRRAGAITSASAAQVRAPIHRNSVGKWLHYERQLQPLRELLLQAGVDA